MKWEVRAEGGDYERGRGIMKGEENQSRRSLYEIWPGFINGVGRQNFGA